jgi:hypothetical protein
MDPLPPNDPNRNQTPERVKEDPPDGRRRTVGRGPSVNANGEREMEIVDLRDQGVVAVMFFLGLVSYLFRERCTC